ncbi:MAG: hypothetical protein VX278_17575, partial [Myxococcota bacterium]|nr:hypothetical protein [Myxococcota bacterium]
PGDTVQFESLVFSPDPIAGVVWFACLPDSANGFGCNLDTELLSSMEDSDDVDFSLLIEAGFAGFEPQFPATWTVPTDALDTLSEEDKLEGISALTTLSVFMDGASDQEDLSLAFKRFPISESTTPNHNPEIRHIEIDDTAYSSDEIFQALPGESYTLNPVITEDSVESYRFLTRDGEMEDRVEEPYFLWFTEGGSFGQYFSLYPYSNVTWTAPTSGFSGRVITVMRDRRGGISWSWITVEVTP